MKPITIPIFISRDVALMQGLTESGDSDYVPTSEWLASFTADERAEIANMSRLYLTTADYASADPVASAARRELAERAVKYAEAAREKAASNARIDAARPRVREYVLAIRIEDAKNYRDEFWPPIGVVGLEYSDLHCYSTRDLGDDETKAHVARLEAERKRQEREDRDARDREYAEKEAQKERARTDALECMRAWAMTRDALVRAATEGYDVSGAVLSDVVNQITPRRPVGRADAGDRLTVLVEGSDDYNAAEWEERKAPSKEAFRIYDAAKLALEGISKPACVATELLRIMRYRAHDESDWTTVVMIRVSCETAGVKDRYVVISAE